MTGSRSTVLISALIALAVGIGGAVYIYATRGDSPAARPAASSPSAPPAPTPKPAAKADPYEVYLKMAPAGAPNLSREDAQARAYLGCGQTFAPGTVDAALAKAYADICKQAK